MSRTFYIENPKKPEVLTIGEILSVLPENFVQYDMDTDNEQLEGFLAMPLNQYGSVLFGQDGISGRGFEVSYNEDDTYGVRFFTPCTKADWTGGFEFIKHLATHLGVSQVVDEEEVSYPHDQISYNYIGDITFGVSCYKEQENSFLFGVNRPMGLNAEIVKKLLSASDKAQAFSEFVENQQYVDAYVAKPIFYQDKETDDIFGIYAITQTVPTILPYEHPPFIDITKYSLNQEDIKEWRVNLGAILGEDDYEHLGEIDYQTFLERLPQEKIQKLDGHYMQVCFDTKEEMKAILEGKPTPQKGFLGKLKDLF